MDKQGGLDSHSKWRKAPNNPPINLNAECLQLKPVLIIEDDTTMT